MMRVRRVVTCVIVVCSLLTACSSLDKKYDQVVESEADFSDETFKKWVDTTPWVGKMSFVANYKWVVTDTKVTGAILEILSNIPKTAYVTKDDDRLEPSEAGCSSLLIYDEKGKMVMQIYSGADSLPCDLVCVFRDEQSNRITKAWTYNTDVSAFDMISPIMKKCGLKVSVTDPM